jgi:hypothetical protein
VTFYRKQIQERRELEPLKVDVVNKNILTEDGKHRLAAMRREGIEMADVVDVTPTPPATQTINLNKTSLRFQAMLRRTYAGNEKEMLDTLRDLAAGKVTENSKSWAFSNLLDFQPVAASEVPEAYLRAGNGRIFYALKTWSLKIIDVYRRDVYQELKSGDRVLGMQNLVRLTAFVAAFGATADMIKDLISGREVNVDMIPDFFVESLAKTFFLNRYIRGKFSEDGLGAGFLGQFFVPPTQAIDNIIKDTSDILNDLDKDIEVNKLRTIRDIPVGGELYYWWFGRGADIRKKDEAQSPGGASIPKVKIPKVKVDIPSLSI